MRLSEALIRLSESTKTGYKGFDDYERFWNILGLNVTEDSVEYPEDFNLGDKGYCRKLVETFLDWFGPDKPDNTFKSSVRIDYLLKNKKEDFKHFGNPKPNKTVFVWNGIHRDKPTMVNLIVYRISKKSGMYTIPSISVNVLDFVKEQLSATDIVSGVLKKTLQCNFSSETVSVLKDIINGKMTLKDIAGKYPKIKKQLEKFTVKEFERMWISRSFVIDVGGDGFLTHTNVQNSNFAFKLSKDIGVFENGYMFDVPVSEQKFLGLEEYFKISRNKANEQKLIS